MTVTKITVTCRVCGDVTIWIDSIPDNQHIVLTAPNKYRCDGCGNFTDCDMQEPFNIEEEEIE